MPGGSPTDASPGDAREQRAGAPALARYLPCLEWGRTYSRSILANDLMAAVIVTIMLIPQSLAYALLADRLRQRIRKPAVLTWLNRLGGGVLVARKAKTSFTCIIPITESSVSR